MVYNPWKPEDACVYLPRKYGKRLKVDRRDEQYIYCSRGMKKDIAIPLELTEDRKKSMMESIEDVSPSKI